MRKHVFCTAAVTLEILALFMGACTDQCAWGQEDTPKETPATELPSPDVDGFISLFNGKDLTHWEGVPGYWSVKDDAITGSETSDKSLHTFLVLSASKADPAIKPRGLLKKSTLDEFRFGLIFFVEWGFWRRFISRAAVLQEGGRHARSASIRAERQGEH